MKRYMILVQHEVIMYGENEKVAKSNLLNSGFMKDRINPQCVYIQELALPEHEKSGNVIDIRRAPGT